MGKLIENYSLKKHNTFGVDVKTRYFYEFSDVREVVTLLKTKKYTHLPMLILGGGSNVLFTRDFEGLILHPNIREMKIIFENNEYTYIKVGAGVRWDDFVDFAVANNFSGVENLSYIPGTVGAAPIQNIGAYGAEVKDVIELVEAVNVNSQRTKIFSNKDCKFGYRTSIFNKELKNKFIITCVTFKLRNDPVINIDYDGLSEEIKKFDTINLFTIREAVINIRKRKLPEAFNLGNAGSFFKNPVVDIKKVKELKREYPYLTSYNVSKREEKIAAGWLIEQCGWKGKQLGNAGVHKKHSLVLVNYGNATGVEIYSLAQDIKRSVKSRFGISLEEEVKVI